MEAHGIAGSVQMSRATASCLSDRFELTSRGLLDLKGKVPMEGILVTRLGPGEAAH